MDVIRMCLTGVFMSGCLQLVAQDFQQSIDATAAGYLQHASSSATIYYGNEVEPYPRTTNHPYFKDIQYTEARLSYNNVIYPDVLLRLDLYREELIALTPDFRKNLLFPENVDFAELHGKHFIYFQKDSLQNCPPSGYYILLHSGMCTLMEKIAVEVIENIDIDGVQRTFRFSTRYYLFKDGKYHRIKNKNGLLKVLKQQKKELKKFISTHRLNFKNDAEMFLIHTIKEYEKLTGKE